MSQEIKFSKYQGTGNDFILIDGITTSLPAITNQTIQEMCHRRFGIGADGLIILRKKEGYDFDMDFYNSDGNPGSMCGNGGRCVVAFAHDLGIIQERTTFWAPDGEHFALFKDHNTISLKMQDLNRVEQHKLGPFMDTGSPHLVIFKTDVSLLDPFNEGKKIRHNDTYKEKGVNVNFVQYNNDSISLITYERGVEDITFSCGTGTVASVIAAYMKYGIKSPVKAFTKGGILQVEFNHISDNQYNNIWLKGPALKTYEGIYNAK